MNGGPSPGSNERGRAADTRWLPSRYRNGCLVRSGRGTSRKVVVTSEKDRLSIALSRLSVHIPGGAGEAHRRL